MAIDDNDLVIRVAGHEAGSDKGQLILTDVTFGAERDNTMYYGIGNDDPQDHSEGNKSYSLSTENVLNEEAAAMLKSVVKGHVNGEDVTALLQAGDALEFNIGRIIWNNVEFNATEDGDVTVTIDADCRNVTVVEGNLDGEGDKFTF